MPDLYIEKNLVIIYKIESHSIFFNGMWMSTFGGGPGQIGCMSAGGQKPSFCVDVING